MVGLRKTLQGFGVGLLGCCTVVSASDIYRAENPDGSFRYATQRLDSNYQLYLKSSEEQEAHSSTFSVKTPSARQARLEPLIRRYAKKHNVDADLVRAVIEVESNFNATAVSPKGASGAMQLMPATAARYGVTQRTNPEQNIEAGIRYLKDLLAMHEGNVALALASYNAGEGSIAKHGKRIPPYKETMLYVPTVLTRLQAARTPTSSESD